MSLSIIYNFYISSKYKSQWCIAAKQDSVLTVKTDVTLYSAQLHLWLPGDGGGCGLLPGKYAPLPTSGFLPFIHLPINIKRKFYDVRFQHMWKLVTAARDPEDSWKNAPNKCSSLHHKAIRYNKSHFGHEQISQLSSPAWACLPRKYVEF